MQIDTKNPNKKKNERVLRVDLAFVCIKWEEKFNATILWIELDRIRSNENIPVLLLLQQNKIEVTK